MTHLDQARRSLQSALAANHALRDVYAETGNQTTQTQIAGLHQAINYGLKAAEVSALIAIAERLPARPDSRQGVTL